MLRRNEQLPVEQLASTRAIMAGRAAKLSRITAPKWDSTYIYRNSETGKVYTPHNEEERRFVYEYTVPFPAILGGEGSGKSVAGIIADLERVRMGMSWIVVSPNLPHFKRSLWPEFRRWCPWQFVVESQRYRQSPEWQPSESFELVFDLPGNPKLLMGGLVGESGRVGTWEGPNVSGAHIDEFRHVHDASGLKILIGRARIPSNNGFKPQVYITSTGGSEIITEYYGPARDGQEHPHPDFKAKTQVIILLTENNMHNLSSDYLDNRTSLLTDIEKEILTGHDPFSIVEDSPFLDNIILWDMHKENLPELGKREPLILALDAGVKHDHFGMIGVTRHPDKARHEDVAVRLVEEWIPRGKSGLDFSRGPLLRIKQLKEAGYYIMCITYDPYQLHQPMKDVERLHGLYVKEFNQGEARSIADASLLTEILAGHVAHDGNATLRQHLKNARKKPDSGKIRLVKKSLGEKIDLSVCLSMGRSICKFLNI